MMKRDDSKGRECVVQGVGTLLGAVQEDVVVFRGIPFAAAPTGKRRFAPPEAAPTWHGVRDTRTEAPIAPQTPSRVYRHMGSIAMPQSEDCLSLTVWRPAESKGPLPVVVWFHGGGFLTGGGALPWYDSSALARRGLVVVAVNYRLGALGFLSVPGVLPGNLAILDQLAALCWVKAHCADLGGDPSRITVMGQSGGAHNIASLLTLEASLGLFQRAILQSPPLGIGLMPAVDAAARGQVFLQALGLDETTPDLIDRLQAVPIAEILQAQTQAARKLGNMSAGDLRPPFTPTELAPHAGGSVNFIEAAAEAAAGRGIEVLLGWTREEANLFLAEDAQTAGLDVERLEHLAQTIYGAQHPKRLEEVWRRRPQGSAAQHFMDLVSDDAFRLPALSFARRVAGAGGRVFVYQFDWTSPDAQLGACHCLELPFVFNSLAAWTDSAMLRGADEMTLRTLAGEVLSRWVKFIESGDPGFPGWEGARQPVFHFNAGPRLESTP